MFADHLVQNIPDFRSLSFHHLLGALNGRNMATLFELIVNKWLEQLEGHVFRQAALMQAQLRTNDDHRTTGVIDTFTQQVLAETAVSCL